MRAVAELDGTAGLLARGAFVASGGKFLGKFAAVLGDVIAARMLGPTDFGLYSIGWTAIRFVGLLAPLGLPMGVLRYVPQLLTTREGAVKRLLRMSIGLAGGAAASLALLLFVGSNWLADSVYHKPALAGTFRLFAPALPFLSLLAVTAAISRSRGEMKYAAVFQDLGQPLMGLALLLGLWVFLGPSTEIVILADVLSFAAAAGVGLWVVQHIFRHHLAQAGTDGPRMREVLAYSLPTAVAGTLSVLVFWIDRLLVGYYLPGEANGLYQAASQVSILFVLVLAGFNAVLAPLFAEGHARQDHEKLELAYQYGTKWGLYVSMPFFIVIALAPRQTLAALFGASYAGAALPMVVLAVGQMLNVATGAVGPLLMMAGQQRLWMRLALAALVLNIAACMILIPHLGIAGAALSTSACLGAMYYFAVLRAKAVLNLWPYHRRYLKGLAAGLLAAVAVVAASAGLGQLALPGELVWLLLLLAAVVSFSVALLALRLDAEDRVLLGVASQWVVSRAARPIDRSGTAVSRGRGKDAP